MGRGPEQGPRRSNPFVARMSEAKSGISLLDHRRYDAESRCASARAAGTDASSAEREIAALVAEHRAYVIRAASLRGDVLRRIDEARAGACA